MRVKIKFENEFLQLTFTIIIIYRHMFVYAQFDVRAQYGRTNSRSKNNKNNKIECRKIYLNWWTHVYVHKHQKMPIEKNKENEKQQQQKSNSIRGCCK